MTTVATHYELVVGIEVHVQLNTQTKLFCSCPLSFGKGPNLNTCPVCLALPGALPVLNHQALEAAIQIGLALHCEIADWTRFDRKQYFYPDLPKGYQISQYDRPICGAGHLTLPSSGKVIRITRAHLEEDAGKLVHAGADGLSGSTHSLVDLNRAGTPLVEVVSEPDIRSAADAREYMMTLRNLVRYLGVCDGNLEEGSMRCDANVSLRPKGSEQFGNRTEIKNMNSFRAVERAIEIEAARQEALLRDGKTIVQESRLWNEATGTTAPMRSKEEAHDYRYFPDPDLKPIVVSADWVARLKADLPVVPAQRLERFTQVLGLSAYDASVLVEFKELGDFLEACLAVSAKAPVKLLTNWIMGDIAAWCKANKQELSDTQLTPQALVQLAELFDAKTIGSPIAKALLPQLLQDGGMPQSLVEAQGLAQVSDASELQPILEKILADNADSVAQYRAGKDKLFGFFVGQAMKATKGQGNPELIHSLLKELLA